MTADAPKGQLVLVRHGQTEWSRSGQHTGLTDLPLLPEGEDDARALRGVLTRFDIGRSFASPLARARRTAELAGLRPDIDDDLLEWDYGAYEGRTTEEISQSLERPWTVFEDGVVPGETPGETVEEVAARASRVVARVRPVVEDGGHDPAVDGAAHVLAAVGADEQERLVRRVGQVVEPAGERDEVLRGLPRGTAHEAAPDVDEEDRLEPVGLDEVSLESTVPADELQPRAEASQLGRQVVADLGEWRGLDRLGRPGAGVPDEHPVARRYRGPDGRVAALEGGDRAAESLGGHGFGHLREPTRRIWAPGPPPRRPRGGGRAPGPAGRPSP